MDWPHRLRLPELTVTIMNDHPIVAGSALFTLVDPNQGHEVAYNRWYSVITSTPAA